MSRGFFAQSLLVKEAPLSLIAKCGACGLFKNCRSPKMPFAGEGRRKILVVGDFPGTDEDLNGKHFVSKAGLRLQADLRKVGVDLRKDCWMTNALICHPPGSRMPDTAAVDFCRPNLLQTIRTLRPYIVILLGQAAVSSLIADTWKDNPGHIDRWVGWNIPDQKYNTWICPTYHPGFLEREKDSIKDLYFLNHLRAAVEHTERPWEETPNWDDQIEVVLDTDKAARILEDIMAEGGVCAGDYENTCLKPEYEGAEIICCSVCHRGKRTIAFPWHGAAIDAMRRAWRSKNLGWIASNLKHEDRWTISDTGRPVRHWVWDTMLGAHTIDNREGITGLKFQSYVYLGMPAYDDHIKFLLKAEGDKRTNKAKTEIDLLQLLKYCGFDTLLEYKVARKQFRILRERDNAATWWVPPSSLHSKP